MTVHNGLAGRAPEASQGAIVYEFAVYAAGRKRKA
jgi:hypothetical protein